MLASGETKKSILKAYPYLEPEDIDESLRYAAYSKYLHALFWQLHPSIIDKSKPQMRINHYRIESRIFTIVNSTDRMISFHINGKDLENLFKEGGRS